MSPGMSVQQPRSVEPRRFGLNQVFPDQDGDSSGKDIESVYPTLLPLC
jgi:hypothetical protein